MAKSDLELLSFVHDGSSFVHDAATGIGYAIGARATVRGDGWTAHVRTGVTADGQLALASAAVECDDEMPGAGLTPTQLKAVSWSNVLDLVASAAAQPMTVTVHDGRVTVSFDSDSLGSFDSEQQSKAVRTSRRRAGRPKQSDDDSEMAYIRSLVAEAERLGVSRRQHVMQHTNYSRATVDRRLKQLDEQDAAKGAQQ